MDRQPMEDSDNRRSSMLRQSNIFDDDYEVDDYEVADGFIPRRTNSTMSRRSGREPPVVTMAAHRADEPESTDIAPRSYRTSIRKSRGFMENPFASAQDEDIERQLRRTSSLRSQSTITYAPGHSYHGLGPSSSRAYARTHTPAEETSDPRHPYHMYPQGTISGRPMSSSTAATNRAPDRTPSTPLHPTHPYSMYPQNVDDEMDDDDDTPPHPQTQIPLGFPGMQQRSAREHDTMSIASHLEQLPPYSEYPEDGAPPAVIVPPRAIPTTIDGTVGMQTRFFHRTRQSMSDGNVSSVIDIEDHDDDDNDEDGDDAHGLVAGPTASLISNKSWSQKSWKEKRKTRFCGVPLGWILLVAGVFLFIVVVLSASIGGFLDAGRAHHKEEQAHYAAVSGAADHLGHPPSSSSSSSETLLDASAIATPSVSALPTGSWGLGLSAAQEVQDDCLTDSTQSGAWSCDITDGQSLAVSIMSPGPDGSQLASVFQAEGNNIWNYGADFAGTVAAPLQLVVDMDDPGRGPAYQFQAMYNKVVVAPPSAFSPTAISSGSSKRDWSHHPSGPWSPRQSISAGEQPWVCFWNSTLVQFFIYSEDNSTSFNASSASSTYSGESITAPMSSGASATPPPPLPDCATTGPVAYSATDSAMPPASTAPSACPTNSQYQPSAPLPPMSGMPFYPYVVKLEERRVPGSPPPYCVKMQIMGNGSPVPIINPDTGEPYTVQLYEKDPGYAAYASARLKSRRKRKTVPGSCHCQWLSGAS